MASGCRDRRFVKKQKLLHGHSIPSKVEEIYQVHNRKTFLQEDFSFRILEDDIFDLPCSMKWKDSAVFWLYWVILYIGSCENHPQPLRVGFRHQVCPQGRSRSPAIPGGQKPLGASVRFNSFWSQWWKDICRWNEQFNSQMFTFRMDPFSHFTMNYRDFIADLGISSKWPKSFTWWSILASWTEDVDGNAFPFVGLRGNMRCGRLFEMQKILTIQ